jgi:DNA polymerase (family 10)
MNAKEISQTITEIAGLLELKGENSFRVRAYENLARMLDGLDRPLADFIADCRKGLIKGVGPQLCEAVEKLYERGHLPLLEDLRNEFPKSLLELFKIQGLGPKKVKVLYQQLHIADINTLEKACHEEIVAGLKGFGVKTQEKILSGIQHYRQYSSRRLLSDALGLIEPLLHYLRQSAFCRSVELAGSSRRCMPTVKDIDIVASSEQPEKCVEYFLAYPERRTVTAQGETKASMLLNSGTAVDLRVVAPAEHAAALLHFTGSKEHNTELRRLAKDNGWKLNEYGLFQGETALRLQSEAELYQHLGLCFIPPECRENCGEIELAHQCRQDGREFPALVELCDIKGILHAHSTYSDGKNSLAEMAYAVKERGYEYFGISDHSQSAIYAGGLKEDDIKRQHEEIDRLNEELRPFRIFKGIEADILAEGQLDYPDRILETFDFVIVSIHSRFSMSEKEMTDRILHALTHPATRILAHPTGRLLLRREPYQMDMAAVLEAAAKYNVAVEINANPRRLDIEWQHLRRAQELGIPIPINPDAHSISGIDHVRFGINTARKGRLSKADVLNTRSAAELESYFAAKR